MALRTVVYPRRGSDARLDADWLLPAMIGAAAGLAVGWLLARKPGKVVGRVQGDGIAWHDRISERLGDGLEAAADSLRIVRTRFVDSPMPDPQELEARLAVVRDAGRIHVAHLGDGIVELTGSSPDAAARAAASSVARVPGVRIVVNRVWTPASEAPPPN